MPYEEVYLDCTLFFCVNNRQRECKCDCSVDELDANDTDCINFKIPETFSLLQEDIESALGVIKDENIPFYALDKDSCHFQITPLKEGSFTSSGPCLIWKDFCLVQGSAEDVVSFDFYRTTEGEYGCKDKNQLELQLS